MHSYEQTSAVSIFENGIKCMDTHTTLMRACTHTISSLPTEIEELSLAQPAKQPFFKDCKTAILIFCE